MKYPMKQLLAPEDWFNERDEQYFFTTVPFTKAEWCAFARDGIWVSPRQAEPIWSVEGANQFDDDNGAKSYPLMNAFIEARVAAGDPLYERLAVYMVRLRLLKQSDTL